MLIIENKRISMILRDQCTDGAENCDLFSSTKKDKMLAIVNTGWQQKGLQNLHSSFV